MTELDRHDIDELRARIDDLERAVDALNAVESKVGHLLVLVRQMAPGALTPHARYRPQRGTTL